MDMEAFTSGATGDKLRPILGLMCLSFEPESHVVTCTQHMVVVRPTEKYA